MIKYNDIYEAEIRDIVENNPKNYIKILKSRGFKGRYPDRQYLILSNGPHQNWKATRTSCISWQGLWNCGKRR